MDAAKRNRLVTRLSAETSPQVVPIEVFFDGNDDLGSIGCNLMEHPGIEAFREVFHRIARRADVEAIYAQISEVDPGDGCWPFSDTVFFVGSITQEDLAAELSSLEPDEVASGAEFGVPAAIAKRHSASILAAWWD